jgi:hypothetical protein
MKLRAANPARTTCEYSQRSRISVQVTGRDSCGRPGPRVEANEKNPPAHAAKRLALQPELIHRVGHEPVHGLHPDEPGEGHERQPEVRTPPSPRYPFPQWGMKPTVCG